MTTNNAEDGAAPAGTGAAASNQNDDNVTIPFSRAADAERLMHHVYGEGSGYFGLASCRFVPGTKQKAEGAAWKEQGSDLYPQSLGSALSQSLELDERGLDVYIAAQLHTEPNRRAVTAADICCLYNDTDNGTLPVYLEPTARVESSPGRFQDYFALTRPVPPARALDLGRRLAAACNTDASGVGLEQVLRIPGTHNRTHPGDNVVQLVWLHDDRAYDPDELDRILPPWQEPVRVARKTQPEPPVRLTGVDLETWRGEHPVLKADGSINRSASLLKLARPVWDKRATRSAVVQMLKERDAALYDKYTRRSDADEQYHRIVDKLERSDAAAQATSAEVENGGDDNDAVQGPQIVTADDLLTKELPQVREVVEGICTEGATILAGRPKKGKSWLGLGVGVAVAGDTAALGSLKVDAGSVLYLALEDGERRVQRRLRALLRGAPAPRRLEIATKWKRLDQGGLDDLKDWLKGHPHRRLVIVDTGKRVRPLEKRGATQYAQDYDALAPLADLAKEFQVCILIVVHTRKADAEDPIDLISGTLGLAGAVDGALILKRVGGPGNAELVVVHRDLEDQTLALGWDGASAGWVLRGDGTALPTSPERQQILDLLNGASGPMQPRAIATALGKSGDNVRFLLKKMHDAEQVEKVTGGYRPVTRTETANATNAANAGNETNGSNLREGGAGSKPELLGLWGFTGEFPGANCYIRGCTTPVIGGAAWNGKSILAACDRHWRPVKR